MKRSEINRALRDMEAMLERCRFALPPFSYYTPADWQAKGHDHDEIRDNMLGWDITDYGLGDFDRVGFSLITLRNGNLSKKDIYAKTYAEKLLFLKEGQYSPNHFHWHKMEDIINRGGGTLLIRVYNSLPDESIDGESDVTVHTDGVTRTVPGFPAAAVDTTGAGDAFWGGFWHRMLTLEKLPAAITAEEAADCARWGNAVAALCITRRGAIPAMPALEAVQAILK